MVRKEDVRATEKDKVEMIKCFRPGDVILGRVVSFSAALYQQKIPTAMLRL
jgi:exosome complex component CSL4